MKPSNKLQTLLTDLLDKIQRRQWHVDCRLCLWTVRNLEHERFAIARGKAHALNAHAGHSQSLEAARMMGYPFRPICKVRYTRA